MAGDSPRYVVVTELSRLSLCTSLAALRFPCLVAGSPRHQDAKQEQTS